MENRAEILRAQSRALDARVAVREFHAAVVQPGMSLVLFFCSSDYDLPAVAEEMNHLFAGIQVVGCTTAGEIGPAGYCDHSLSGASFPACHCLTASGRIDHLKQFQPATGHALVQKLLQKQEKQAPDTDSENTFALLMIDGLCVREEIVTRSLQGALGRLPLIGGSAGDSLHFGCTHVFSEGRFHTDSAVLTLVTTDLPFKPFMTQHFVTESKRFTVTRAAPAQRVVHEIDGWPAAAAYADMVGVAVQDLGPMHFATWPTVVVIAGTPYVRSISRANRDGSLTFFCTIEEGMVLHLARGTNLVADMDSCFGAIRAAIGEPQLVIGCDCILRRLEIVQSRLVEPVEAAFRRNKVIGFAGYGEQYLGIHINQTLTGIAIGGAEGRHA